MIVKLPIKINDKILHYNFIIKVLDNKIIVSCENINNYIKVAYTNNYGIDFYSIYFPLVFYIENNYLINEYFLIFSLISTSDICNNNFFYILIKLIKEKINDKLKIYRLEEYNLDTIERIIKIINSNFTFNTKFNSNIDFDSFLKNIFNKYQFYLNISLSLIYQSNKITNKFSPSKRIKSCIKELYKKNIYFYGLKDTFENHLKKIKVDKIKKNVEINDYIFMSNKKNKNNRLYVLKTDNKFIYLENKKILYDNFNLYYYPHKFKNLLIVKNLFFSIINSDSNFNIIKIIIKNDIQYNNIINYFYTSKIKYLLNLSIFNNLNKNDIFYDLQNNNICDDSISFDFFCDEIKNLKFNKMYLLKLLDNYSFPLNYIRDDFSITFKKILFFIFKYNNEIKKDTNIETLYKTKYKILFTFILNFYTHYINNDISFFNNTKIFTESLYFLIINIHFTNKFNIFDMDDKYYSFKNTFYNNYKLYQIINFLNWDNFKYNLNKLKLLCENRDSEFLYFENKLKKNFYIYFDNNLLKIIQNPFFMCQYLQKKNDFIKWVKMFKNDINLIFDNVIKINYNDYEKIGKVLYYIFTINEQNLNNKDYKQIIDYLSNHKNLITYNCRININKDILINKNINLGYLSKHVFNNNTNTITFSDTDDDLEKINEKYKSTRKKYFKYKSKYLDLKSSEISSNLNNLT